MRNSFDFHIHTRNSDGQYDTAAILAQIREKGLTAFSITDHDNIDSIKDMAELHTDSHYIKGVEISSIVENHYKVHILGYGFDENNYLLKSMMAHLKNKRTKRFIMLAKQLYDQYGLYISEEEALQAIEHYNTIGKPHLARLMVKHGYVESTQQAFARYLQDIKVSIANEADAVDSIYAIKQAGGYAFWAHPVKTEREFDIDFTDIMEQLRSYGIDGLEIGNCLHGLDDYNRFLNYCRNNGLLTSAGSDYHGPAVKPDVHLGVIINDHPEFLADKKDISLFDLL